jgi:hypothetical protein
MNLFKLRPAPALLAAVLAVAALPSHALPDSFRPQAAKKDCPTAVERMIHFTKDGVAHKGEIRGNQLMLTGKDGKMAPAPDGKYQTPEGKTVVVKDGKITSHGAGGGGGAG